MSRCNSALRTLFSVANRDDGEEPVVARHTIRKVWCRGARFGYRSATRCISAGDAGRRSGQQVVY